MAEPVWALGFMSGTSLDGVDAALIRTDGAQVLDFGPWASTAYAPQDRAILQRAVDAARAWAFSGPEPQDTFAPADVVLTRTHADLGRRLLAEAGLAPDQVLVAGFHGQTVLHRAPRDGQPGATRQIGDGARLARALGLDVVFDFRSADVASGGHGAPLAPIYHAALARSGALNAPLGVLNLGGVANLTVIDREGGVLAFDTGPANGLLDQWVSQQAGLDCDQDGRLAAAGRVDTDALAALLAHPYYAEPPPKSLDRYDFTLDPVARLSLADGAATLTALTARTVADAAARLEIRPARLLACGGGRRNPTLMARLSAACAVSVEPVEAMGWRGDAIEAEAFAFMAVRSSLGLATSLPGAPGAPRPIVGGRRAAA
ncbi:MAG: anhydro-N-acetylmuramic acid kinase [Maricaulaceae bacterium]